MTEKQQFTEAFSHPVYEFVKAHNNAPSKSHLKKKLKEALKTSLQKWSDTCPSYISKDAEELAKQYKINLSTMLWPNREVCGKIGSKSKLVWEHTTPLGELFDALITCNSLDDVIKILNDYSGVCWITREEDDKLNKGHKNKRPNGWKKSYEECGIDIIKLE
jgi:hypothetical protein